MITEQTKKYRESQFERAATADNEYKTAIKFANTNGSTNWMDIEDDEYRQIQDILTGK